MAEAYAGTRVLVTVDRDSVAFGIGTPVPEGYEEQALDAYAAACAVALRDLFPGAAVDVRVGDQTRYTIIRPVPADEDAAATGIERLRREQRDEADARRACEYVYQEGAFWPDRDAPASA
jgi:hypothetical protein